MKNFMYVLIIQVESTSNKLLQLTYVNSLICNKHIITILHKKIRKTNIYKLISWNLLDGKGDDDHVSYLDKIFFYNFIFHFLF